MLEPLLYRQEVKRCIGFDALDYCVKKNIVVSEKRFLNLGVSPLLRSAGVDDEMHTTLHTACLFGHTELVSLLLDFGADVDARTNGVPHE